MSSPNNRIAMLGVVVGAVLVLPVGPAVAAWLTIDNFNEGDFDLTDTTVGDGPASASETGLNTSNVLSGSRHTQVILEGGSAVSGFLSAPPDQMVTFVTPNGSGSRFSCNYSFSLLLDLTAGGLDRFRVTLGAGTHPAGTLEIHIDDINTLFSSAYIPITGPGSYECLYSGMALGGLLDWTQIKHIGLAIHCPLNAGPDLHHYLDDFSATPEPATLALVGAGLAGLLLRRRRKAATAAALLLGMGFLLAAAPASATTLLTEDFESGQNGWTMVEGTWATSQVDAAHGQSWLSGDGLITRAAKAFDSGTSDVVTLRFEFYTNSTAEVQRSFGGLATVDANNMPQMPDSALVRLGCHNSYTYQIHYISYFLQTFDTGVPLAVGWHEAEISLNLSSKTIDWRLDGTSGTISSPYLIRPNGVILGFQYSNGIAGDPDTSTWFDNVQVTPEPATLALVGLGGLGLVLSRKRR